MILYKENPKDSAKTLRINKSNQIAEYKISKQKLLVSIHWQSMLLKMPFITIKKKNILNKFNQGVKRPIYWKL